MNLFITFIQKHLTWRLTSRKYGYIPIYSVEFSGIFLEYFSKIFSTIAWSRVVYLSSTRNNITWNKQKTTNVLANCVLRRAHRLIKPTIEYSFFFHTFQVTWLRVPNKIYRNRRMPDATPENDLCGCRWLASQNRIAVDDWRVRLTQIMMHHKHHKLHQSYHCHLCSIVC